MLLVTSGLDPGAHTEHEAAASAHGARAFAAGRGLSTARNRALLEAADGDVLAFIDDDAVPASGWLAALARRWEEASPDVACIGGAILPRWSAPPPAWVSERIFAAFSLLDLGDGVVDLDPGADLDAWGANISFRAGALREVGGFDAALGAWGGVPLSGEESAVQHRLVAAGHRLIYAGDIRVEHRIGADRLRLRGLWRREFFRGVSSALGGRPSPPTASARALKAGAGLSVALVCRRSALAGERFARLARNSGAAVAPLVRARLRARGWPQP